MANRWFTQFVGSFHKKPVLIDCNFIVDHSNANGLGIRSLKGMGVSSVFMNTSSTPAGGNPNPAAGLIVVNFQDNWNRYFSGFSGFIAPVTGSSILIASSSVLTAGNAYVITVVGTSTAANWQAVGLAVGIVPAVGVSFIASVTGGGTGTGAVHAVGVSTVSHLEPIGDPNLGLVALASAGSTGGGGQMIFQVIGATSSSVTTNIPKAPADNTVIGMSFLFSNSSIITSGS
jgi:hypothetical protein